MRGLFFLSLMVWFILLSGSSGAEEHIFFQDENLVISGEGHLETEAEYLWQIYPKAKRDIENIISLRLLSKPTVLLIGNKDIFEKISGSPFVSALAVPSRHLIVIHISSVTSKAYMLNDTFKHELCHLILHDHIKASNLPKWLDEGICQWISGTLGEILVGEGVTISRIDMARHLIPLKQLAISFPKDKDTLFLAYKESHDFVEYLTAHYGTESLLNILKYLKEGVHIDLAIAKALSKSFQEVQEEWIDDMQKRSEWLIWASQHLYEILFFIAAVLAVLASVRLRARRNRYSEDDGDD